MIYKTLVRPVLFLEDPEKAHDRTLRLLANLGTVEGLLKKFFSIKDSRLQINIGPLTFTNPVGLAAGFDKNGKALGIWPGFGFAFIEMGAITALAQPGNPKPRLYRLPKDKALINRLGFNNEGAEAISVKLGAMRVKGLLPRIPLGINIGRSRVVDTKDAAQDYLFTFQKLFPFGDYFTVNVSSPNTPNLRDLQERSRLEELLGVIQLKNQDLARQFNTNPKPVFLKIAPDMELSQLDQIISVAQANHLSGLIATNASAFLREQLATKTSEPGGLSGRPLRARATAFVRHIYNATLGQLPVIGSGGVFTAEDAYEKIKAGATAVQIYTGLVYEGPAIVKKINRGLLKLLDRDGIRDLAAAVGIESGNAR
jgi:dihydroorotate dehydrogenase